MMVGWRVPIADVEEHGAILMDVLLRYSESGKAR
jgi:hypothetical protein